MRGIDCWWRMMGTSDAISATSPLVQDQGNSPPPRIETALALETASVNGPAPTRQRVPKWMSIVARYAIGVGIIFWLVRSNRIEFSHVFDIGLFPTLFGISMAIGQLFLSGWRVQALLAAHNIRVSLLRCTLYNAIGIFYSTFLPGGMSGDAAKMYCFYRNGCANESGRAALIGALLTDRLIGMVVMLCIGLMAATWSADALKLSRSDLAIVWSLFSIGLVVYAAICRVHRRSSAADTTQTFKARFRRVLGKLDVTSYPPKVLAFTIASSAVIHMSAIAIIYAFSRQVESGLDLWQVMAVAPVGLLVNAIPLSPGGLGIGEKGFDTLYHLVGGTNGGSAFLISRIFLFSPALLGGIAALWSLVRSRPNPVIQKDCRVTG